MSDSPNGLNSVIHAPMRLQICAFLSSVDEVEFGTLRDMLGVADSVLSKHLSTLRESEYVKIEKHAIRGRARTWIAFSELGKAAYGRHLRALRELLAL